jgi:putative transposase
MIEYKAKEKGIAVVLTEESYTSGTSFLDGEEPVKENYDKSRRVHRGLFKANDDRLINADVNGAFQILRKVFPNVSADGIEGVVLRPVVVVAA